jgi:hypothetical protein
VATASLVFGYYDGQHVIYVARTRNGFTPSSREALFRATGITAYLKNNGSWKPRSTSQITRARGRPSSTTEGRMRFPSMK